MAKVLIIEDDQILARMYSEKFNLEGFHVLLARDGESGIETAINDKPDFILLDILLPRMKGGEVLEKLRADEWGKNVPVIALTNLASDQERDKAMKMGAIAYLVKAMHTPDEIVKKVKEHIGGGNDTPGQEQASEENSV